MKKVLIVMMLLAQSAGVYAQANLEDRHTANTPPPIADDHTALKGQRQTPDPPTIRITRSDTLPQTNNSIYDVDFVIQSNENISDIGTTASYKIARCLNKNCTTRDTTTTYIPSNISSANPATGFPFARSISAAITLNNLADIQATWGFVLLRASASALRNANGIAPINTNGDTINPNDILGIVGEGAGEGAIARRDRIPPKITLSFRQIRNRGKSGRNNIYDLVFWVITDKTIPALNDIRHYHLIRVLNTDAPPIIFSRRTLQGEIIKLSGRPVIFQLILRIFMSDDELESTKGFTLARAEDDDLLDIWGNPPVRADDTLIRSWPNSMEEEGIAEERKKALLSTTLISPSLADPKARIRAKVFLEGPLR